MTAADTYARDLQLAQSRYERRVARETAPVTMTAPAPMVFQPGPEEDPYYGTPYAADATPEQMASVGYIPDAVYVSPPVPLTPSQEALQQSLFGQPAFDLQAWLPYIAIGGGLLLILMMNRD